MCFNWWDIRVKRNKITSVVNVAPKLYIDLLNGVAVP